MGRRLRGRAAPRYLAASRSAITFFARAACFSVMTPASTMRSIRRPHGIRFSQALALRMIATDSDSGNL